MTKFLGHQECVESLRKDVYDLQGIFLEVFSRTGPVRAPSWKFPDKLSCNLDLVSLLAHYDFIYGDDEFSQHSHVVLLELVIDRLLLLLQSFNVYAELLRSGQSRDHTPKKGCVSVGLVVRQYWNNLIKFGDLKGTCTDNQTPPETKRFDSDEKAGSVVPAQTCDVGSQTIESSLVPCDACNQVQSVLRQMGDALVELCQSEGLPSSLQPLLEAVEDSAQMGRLTASDIGQWAREPRRDMGRLRKHLQDMRGTVQTLRDKLAAAESEREHIGSQLEATRESLKLERTSNEASKHQIKRSLQEAQRTLKETENRRQVEQQQLQSEMLSLEESNSRLNEELASQLERLNVLECEKNELQKTAGALQIMEEAHHNLQERTQRLESQICESQLSLDKESAKYQSACRQQESMQAKQKSLLERLDALDQDCVELQRQLVECEERESDLQKGLRHLSQEKDQLFAQFTEEQALHSEVQKERLQLESRGNALKSNVAQLQGEVQELKQRERLLVAFPELSPLHKAQAQSTGDVQLDMEQQLEANCVRIQVLEQENVTLLNSLGKLRERAQTIATKDTSPAAVWTHPLPNTTPWEQQNSGKQRQHSPLRSSNVEQLKYDIWSGAGDGQSVPEPIRPGDRKPNMYSSPPAASPTSLLLHCQGLSGSPGTGAVKTFGQLRRASSSVMARRHAMNQWKK